MADFRERGNQQKNGSGDLRIGAQLLAETDEQQAADEVI
jgi:hypothetical protein